MVEAYSKIKFLELEIIQGNVKVERISTKKLDNMLSSQKSSHDKTNLGYTGEGSFSSKKVEEEHRCILVQLKEAKCEIEGLKRELVEAYSKIKFLELEIIQTNVKFKRISTKKLDNVLSSQKSSHDKTGLGYTGEGSSSSEPKKEVRFVLAKNDEKINEVKPEIDTPTVVKRIIGAKPKEKGKSLPKNQRGP